MKIRRTIVALIGVGALCAAWLPALGEVPEEPALSRPAPGTLNYIEGSAYLDGSPIGNKSVGSAEMNPGEILRTRSGRAEVLLTPGVFLRLGERSAVKMISPGITNTQVALLGGEAGVEVDEIHPQNDLQIVDNGVTTELLQRGFYEFTANQTANQTKVLVFSGKAKVELGDGQYRDVKKHREMALVEGAQEKPQRFNASQAEDGLYNWSKLRSQYLVEQDEQAANEYGWGMGYGPGWFWNPWDMGYGFWGQGWGGWGWGPGWGWGGSWWGGGIGFYGGGYGYGIPLHGHYGRGFHGNGGHGYVNNGGFHQQFHGGEAFHGGGGFRGGGGFHGGGGGGRR
ncbi:MAG: FecR domain-containing protein [Terracidiphilus sp.]